MKPRVKLLLPEHLEEVFRQSYSSLPDSVKNIRTFYGLYADKRCVFFDVGNMGGAMWLANLQIGFKASIHLVLWEKDLLGRPGDAKLVLKDIMDMFSLKRVEVYIPAGLRFSRLACRYAEKVGMVLEGVLRKSEFYGGERVDIYVYSILLEEI